MFPAFSFRVLAVVVAALPILAGCGFRVPDIAEPFDRADAGIDAGGTLERDIKLQIFCELRDAVIKATSNPDVVVFRDNVAVQSLPDDWGVQLTLSLTVDESTAANPGVSLNTPLQTAFSRFAGQGPVSTPQSFTFGFGGTYSAAATRIDKFSSYYDIALLKLPLGKSDTCYQDVGGERRLVRKRGSSFLLESDLGISRWLQNALVVEHNFKSTPMSPNADPAFKQDILSYEVKFVVTTNASATPTWKLVRISANTGNAALASVGRTRTHDLLLTFGPSQKPKAPPAGGGGGGGVAAKSGGSEPSLMAANAHLASQIGLSVGNNLKSGGVGQ